MRLLLALVAALTLAMPSTAWAHSDLQRAEPAPGSAVRVPPAELWLRFSEPLDASATQVEVVDERGAPVDRADLTLGPPNDRVALVGLVDLGEGVYSVRWSTLSQIDGHRWQGVYRFAVGRIPPPTTEGPTPLPSALELAVQWFALAATALVVGGLVFRTVVLDPALASRADPGVLDWAVVALRRALWLLGAASAAELVGSLGLLAGQPVPLGKAGGLALLRLALVPMIGYLAAPSAPSGSAPMALAFAGMLILARGQVGHSAAGGLGPVLLDTAHQAVASVWLGGTAAFAILAPRLLRARSGLLKDIVVRFSRLGAAAAGLALVTGLANAWSLGLEWERLLDSRYGQTLVIKLGLIAVLIGAAGLVWRRFRTTDWPPARARAPMALSFELVVGAAVLLAAAGLALLPPPSEAAGRSLDLARVGDGLRVHLVLDRVRVGVIEAEVRLESPTDVMPAESATIQLEAEPLDVGGRTAAVSVPGTDGRLAPSFTAFDGPGWWRVTVLTTVGQSTIRTPFELLVPDPNRGGVDPPVGDSQAERQFAQTLDRMEALRAVRQREALSDGGGGLIISTAEYVAPDRFRLTTREGDESITVGAVQMFRRAGQDWRPVRRSTPFHYPAYRASYEGAIGHRLGREDRLEGSATRVLSFYVPRDRAWYCWWIGDDDGLVHQEAMIAPAHYMTSRLDRFNEPRNEE